MYTQDSFATRNEGCIRDRVVTRLHAYVHLNALVDFLLSALCCFMRTLFVVMVEQKCCW